MTKKKDKEIKEETNVLLKGASKEEVEKIVNNSKKTLKVLEKSINNIHKIISKTDIQERFFVLDGLVGMLFQISNLPPYIISSICGKYNLISQLPYTMQNVQKEEYRGDYIG